MADIQILNTIVDANNWISMEGISFSPAYKKHNEAKPIDGITPASLPEGDRIGIEPASFIIRGVIDVNDFDSDSELWSETPSTLTSTSEDGSSNASRITMGYLNALWRQMNGQTKIRIYFGDPSSQKRWKNWDNSSYELYVVVDDINPIPDTSSDGLHFINYTITMREVQADNTFTT